MTDLVDMTAKPGEAGWHVVPEDQPHRCSRKFCKEPAVVYYYSRIYGRPGYWRRRFTCAEHLNESTSTPWLVIEGRLVRERRDWEKERDR